MHVAFVITSFFSATLNIDKLLAVIENNSNIQLSSQNEIHQTDRTQH